MLEKASKTNSIGHVIAPENRHLSQFRNPARFSGKEIIRENISVRYAFVDDKLVAVADEATAVMRDKPKDASNLGVKSASKPANDMEVEKAN